MDEAKPHPDPKDYHEGEEAARRFTNVVRRMLSVSPAELKKRDEQWKKGRKIQRKRTQGYPKDP